MQHSPPLEQVTFTRRLLADELLEIALFFLTLGVGWFVWLAIVAPRGRTPAKDFANVTIYDYRSVSRARWQQVWLREVWGKAALPAMLAAAASFMFGPAQGSAIFGVYHVAGALSPLVLEERRAIWDHVAGTFLVYEPRQR